jgi:hypothetical protein
MKPTRNNLILRALLVVVVMMAAASCTRHYSGLTVSQVQQMAPFKATVEKITVGESFKKDADVGLVVFVWLKTENGKRVSIGGRKATVEMLAFARSLRQGHTYSFPQVLSDYEKSTGHKLQ